MGSGNETSSNVIDDSTSGKGLHTVFFISNPVTDFREHVGELLFNILDGRQPLRHCLH
jgi:hypothetical protein